MNSKYKNLLKDTLIFALGSLGSKIILFFLVPLYTNYLTTDEYGISELVTTFSQLIMPITSLAISYAVIRFGMKNDEKAEDVLFSAFVVLVFSVVAVILVYPALGFYKPLKLWRVYLCIHVVLSNFTEVEKTYLKVKNRNKLFAIISILQTAVLAGTNIILLIFYHQGVKGYLIANIAATIGVAMPFFASDMYDDLRKGRFDMDLIKKMIIYSSPLIFSNISWWVVHSSDKIMIEGMITASALGIYTAATKIPSLINVIIAIFNQAWGISSIKEIESTNDNNFYTTTFDLFSTFLFSACLIFITFIKPFMSIYVGHEFKDSWVYTPLLLVSAVFFSISAFVGTLYSAIEKTKNDMWTTVLCAVINLFVNYIGIKAFGTWGAVIGTVTAYFVCSTIRILDIKQLMHIDISSIYFKNSIFLLIYSVVVSLQLYPLLMQFVGIILFVLINKKFIIVTIKKLYIVNKS